MAKQEKDAAYDQIIQRIFFNHYESGAVEFDFIRREIKQAHDDLDLGLDLNQGDVLYTYRFRRPLPDRILETQAEGLEWIIELVGRSKYRFRQAPATRIVPNPMLASIAIADATPEIIRAYKLDDEQALLAVVRYNRLIDTFLGLTTYSLQNHLRTSVKGVGQIEIDELYVGIDKRGCHYVIPVQAKGGKDQIGVVQITQDIRFAEEKFPGMRFRPIAAQFMPDGKQALGKVAMFELTLEDGQIRVVDERHYKLVPAADLDRDAIKNYRE